MIKHSLDVMTSGLQNFGAKVQKKGRIGAVVSLFYLNL